MKDTNKRSIVKTLSWRLTGSAATFGITYLISGNIQIAGSVAVVQIVANTLLYYAHERIWNKINWGKE